MPGQNRCESLEREPLAKFKLPSDHWSGESKETKCLCYSIKLNLLLGNSLEKGNPRNLQRKCLGGAGRTKQKSAISCLWLRTMPKVPKAPWFEPIFVILFVIECALGS